MPKAPAFTPKAPVEKLPLAVRKDLRENYESKKADYETEISGLLGFPVKINIDVNFIWAYAQAQEVGASQAGSTFTGYIDGFISALKSYVENFGDLGKEYFKNAVTKGELTLTVNELGDKAETITADVKDGVFRILFKETRLGFNMGWLTDYFVNAIDQAPHEGFGLVAKHSIEKEYNDEIDDVRQEIAEVLALPDVVLDANFEENYAKLLKKDEQDWQKNFGEVTLKYFRDGFLNQIISQGFKGDDMIQEGFADAVTTKTIKFRLVEKTQNGYYNEAVIENGTVYLQTTINRWYFNVSETGSGLLEKL